MALDVLSITSRLELGGIIYKDKSIRDPKIIELGPKLLCCIFLRLMLSQTSAAHSVAELWCIR